MNIQQIRNATLKITYHGKRFYSIPGFAARGKQAASMIFPAVPSSFPNRLR